jgi:hypothetical protein
VPNAPGYAAASFVMLLVMLAAGKASELLPNPATHSTVYSVKTETFRSVGRGPHKTDDMVRITVVVQRGPKAERIKQAIRRAMKAR